MGLRRLLEGLSAREFTDDERPPQSTVPLGIQGAVAGIFSVVVFLVVVFACCLSRPGAAWHAALHRAFGQCDRVDRCCANKAERSQPAALKSPLLVGAVAKVLCAERWLTFEGVQGSVLAQQTYLIVWKLFAEKARDKAALFTYFGFPLIVSALTWLLYAVFSEKKSSGAIEQYLVLLGFTFGVQSVAAAIANEKEKRLKLSLKQMGLREDAHWAALYLVEAGAMASALALALAAFGSCTRLFHNAGRGFGYGVSFGVLSDLFLLFWSYGAAATSLAVLISTVVDSAPTASMVSFGMTIVGVVTFIVVKLTAPGAFVKAEFAWLLCPPLALELAVASFSSTFARFPLRSRIAAGRVSLSLCGDAVLIGLFAAYLAQVLPSEFGTRDSIWFPLRASWNGLKAAWRFSKAEWRFSKASLRAGSDDDDSAAQREEMRSPLTPGGAYSDCEDVGEDSPTVSIQRLRKCFGKHVALNDVSLDLREGEIVALLGHNGAGKSTLINILTGLMAAESGSAHMYGRELGSQHAFRGEGAVLGVCPQHDVLWPSLTVREHTALCSALKAGFLDASNENGDALLKTFGLADRHDHLGHELSGGMRRKLSTACALVGGSRFVILDEPTSGLDPLARRELWAVLATSKPGRTLLLTSHYMDEADALGDVVAILARGRVQSVGAPDALKRALGAGYKLTIELHPKDGASKTMVESSDPNSEEDDVELRTIRVRSPRSPRRIKERPTKLEAFLEKSVGAGPWRRRSKALQGAGASRCEFTLPFSRAADFGPCLRALEDDVRRGGELFGIAAFGVSQCDLEDVFEKYVKEARVSPVIAGAEEDQDSSTWVAGAADAFEDDGALGDVERKPWRWSDWRALQTDPAASGFLRKVLALARKRILIASRDARTLNMLLPLGCVCAAFALNARDDFGPRGHFAANITTSLLIMLAFVPTTGFVAMEVTAERACKLRDVLTVAGCSSRAYLAGTVLGDFVLFSCPILCVGVVMTITVLSTSRSSDVLKLRLPDDAQELPESVIYRGFKEYVDTHRDVPFPEGDDWIPTTGYHTWLSELTDDKIHTLEERFNLTDDGWRDFTLQSHDNEFHKWLKHGAVVWLFPWLFAVQLVSFSYASSFACASPRQAVLLVPMLLLGLLFAPATLLALINLTLGDQGLALFTLSKQAFLGVLLWGAALTTPHGALMMALAHASTNLETFASGFPPLGATCSIAFIETVLYALLTYYLDRRPAARVISRVAWQDPDGAEDADVWAEAEASQGAFSRGEFAALHFDSLRKVYNANKMNKVVAVKALSLRIQKGEIFGLLGANGAGKTTAISMTMRSCYPSAGDVCIQASSVLDDFERATRHLGVVTQHDALYDRLTAREHCQLFAALRDVEPHLLEEVVATVLSQMHLDTAVTKTKLAGQLSGGQKRKLCTAVALIGGPSVVLLDEPSAGLDPVSRRSLWDVLRATMADRAACLTSHSMEEAEALCTRCGVMARGELVALGTPQHLKSKFVAEYSLALELLPGADFEKVGEFGTVELKATPRESVKKGAVHFTLRNSDVDVADVFEAIESNKSKLGIDAYSLQQPTLEQVFINVVHNASLRATSGEHDDGAASEADAAALLDAATCCGLDRSAHRFIAIASGLGAVLIFTTMTGLIGPQPSWDDDERDYDDAHRKIGCHRDKTKQSPCSTSAINLDGIPFFAAVIIAIVGCCGCCCCLRRTAAQTAE